MTPSVALASQAYATIRHRFAAGGRRRRGLFHEHAGGGRRGRVAFNWTFSHAFAAALDVYGLDGEISERDIDELLAGLRRYWDDRRRAGVPAYSSTVVRRFRRSERFFDDNAWCGLNLMRLHRMAPTRTDALEQAKATFAFAGEEYVRIRTRSDACAPGGIHWQEQRGNASPDIGTVANAANAQLALRLHEATGDAQYLDVAIGMCSWVNEYMRDPANGLFWDHVTPPDCRIDQTQWSYNQGLMIGTNVLLYRATADERYLHDGRSIGAAALALFDATRLADEPAEFAVILLRNLLLSTTVANPVRRDDHAHRRAEQYAHTVWPRFADAVDSPPTNSRLIEQAAIVESIALPCWPAARYDLLV